MTVGQLIKNKDYDYMSWRIELPKELEDDDTLFVGATKSKDGKLISLDGDSYSEDTEILRYEEWSNNEIKNGIDIIIKGRGRFCRS